MAGNLKALTPNELTKFLNTYDFELLGNYVIVKCKTLKRKTLKEADVGFSLSINKRKINITKNAINIWKNKYLNSYSLIEVQNAINTLIITYQNVNDSKIEQELKRMKSKYNNN